MFATSGEQALQLVAQQRPDLILSDVMPVSEEINRLTNCTEDISNEKKAIGLPYLTDAFLATESTKAVFPIPGRAAMMIRSDFCQPAVTRSSSVNPLGTPVTPSFWLAAISISFMAFDTVAMERPSSFARVLIVILLIV